MKRMNWILIGITTIFLSLLSCKKDDDSFRYYVVPGVEEPRDSVPPLIFTPKENFTMYHLVRYNDTPSDLMPYLHPTKIANEPMLLVDNKPNPSAIKDFARETLDQPDMPVTLDLETWPYFPIKELEQTVSYFLQTIDIYRSENPTTPIGFYGVPPKPSYQWKNIDPETNPTGYENWVLQNEGLTPVAEGVDVFYPSFYMYEPDTTSWRKMVDKNIVTLQEYDEDKPIYAYIWPQFHEHSETHALEFIDPEVWKFQLDILRQRTDGVVIWTSNRSSQGDFISWDPNMEWFQVTKEWMFENDLVPPFVLEGVSGTVDDDVVTINWITSLDVTTEHFVVQKANSEGEFEDISGEIVSEENPFLYTEYSYEDKEDIDGVNHYRIRIVDKLGGEDYTYSIEVEKKVDEPDPGGKGELEDGALTMSFTSQVRWGSEQNTLHLYISKDFDENYSEEGINKATWIEITDKAELSTQSQQYKESGTIDLTEYVERGEPFYFAFRLLTDPSKGTQRTWWIKDFEILNNEDDKVLIDLEYSSLWEPVSISGKGKWGWITPEGVRHLSIDGGTADDPANDNWVITHKIIIN